MLPQFAQELREILILGEGCGRAARMQWLGRKRRLVRYWQHHQPDAALGEHGLKSEDSGPRVGVDSGLARVQHIFLAATLDVVIEKSGAAYMDDARPVVQPAIAADDGQLIADSTEASEQELKARLRERLRVRSLLDVFLELVQIGGARPAAKQIEQRGIIASAVLEVHLAQRDAVNRRKKCQG